MSKRAAELLSRVAVWRLFLACILVVLCAGSSVLAGTVSWNIDADGLWTLPSNWSGGVLPGPADDVVIDRPAGDYLISLDSGSSAVRSLTLNERMLLSGGSLQLSGPSNFNNAFTFRNSALLTGSGTITNNGTFTSDQQSAIAEWGAGLTINNTGSFVKSGAGSSYYSGVFNNSGTVSIQPGAGYLEFYGSSGVDTGSFIIPAGTRLFLSGHTLQPGSSVSGAGELDIEAGVNNYNIPWTFGGFTTTLNSGVGPTVNFNEAVYAPVTVQSGTVNFAKEVTAAISVTGGTANFAMAPSVAPSITSGALNFNSAMTLGGIFSWSGGTVGGTGALTLGGSVSWQSGTLAGGPAPMTVGATGSVTVSGGAHTLARSLVNNGTFTLKDNALLTGSGTITNNGTFTSDQQSSLAEWGAGLTINNNGNFVKSGVSSSYYSGVFNNNGTVSIQPGAGYLEFYGSSGVDTGSFIIPAGTRLFLSGHTLQPGSSVIGAGELDIEAGVNNYNIPWTFGGFTTTLNSAAGPTVNFNEAVYAPVTVQSGTVNFAKEVTAAISVTGGTANFAMAPSVAPSITSGALNFNSAMTLGGISSWSGGTVGGSGALTLGGSVSWQSGTLAGGPAPMTVGATGSVTVSGGAHTLARSLVNNGTFTLKDNALLIGSGTITNNGTFISDQQLSLAEWGAGLTINNNGNFVKSGVSSSYYSGVFNNNGTVSIQPGAGYLEFYGSSGVDTGSFIVPAGTKLYISGHTLQPGASIIGEGEVYIEAGVNNYNIPWTFAGITSTLNSSIGPTVNFNEAVYAPVTVQSGTVNFAKEVTAAISVTGGTANFAIAPSVAPAILSGAANFNGGYGLGLNLSAPATANFNAASTLEGPSSFTSGTVGGSGRVTIGVASTFIVSGDTSPKTLFATLDNGGSMTISASGAGSLRLGAGASLTNKVTGTMTLLGAGTIIAPSGSAMITNAGAFISDQQSANAEWGAGLTFNNTSSFLKLGNGFSYYSGVFNNNGTVSIQPGAGYLEFYGGSGVDTGSFIIPAGTRLFLSGHTLQPGSSVSGAGEFDIEAGVNNFNIPWTFGGFTTTLNSGVGPTVNFNEAVYAPVTVQSGTVNFAKEVTAAISVTGGTANFAMAPSVAPSITSGALNFNSAMTLGGVSSWSGGTVGGSGALTLGGSVSWQSGTLAGGPAPMTVGATGSMTVSGGAHTLARSLVNNGTFTLKDNALLTGSGTITNNGTFTSDQQISLAEWGAGLTINNNGNFVKSGVSSSYYSGVFNNNGTVSIQPGAGYLEFYGSSGVDTGSFIIPAGTRLFLSGHTLQPGSSVIGAGELDIEAGVNNYNIPWTFGGSTTTLNSAAGPTVNFNEAVYAPVTVQSGTVNFAKEVTAAISVTGGTANFAADSVISGLSNVNSGTINGHATILYSGQLVWTGGSFSATGGIGTVPGGLIITSGDLSLPRPLVNNGGQLVVASGTLALVGGGTDAGVISVADRASVIFAGGSFDLRSGASFVGAGLASVGGGNVQVSGTVESGGMLSVASGNLTVKNGGWLSADLLPLTGGTVSVEAGGIIVVGGLQMGGLSVSLASDSLAAGKLILHGNVSVPGPGVMSSITTTLFSNGQTAGTLDLGAFSRTFYVLDSTSSLSISARITNGSLIKDGSGSLSLSGPLAFTGGLTVLGGTTTITTPATFNTFTGGVTLSTNGLLAGMLAVSSDDQLGDLSNTINISGGTLAATATFATARPITLPGTAGDGSISVSAANIFTLNSPLTGPGGLTKTGPGTLALNAPNTFTGQTLIQAGTLRLSGNASLDPASVVTVNSGATLDLGGGNDAVGALKGAGLIQTSGSLTVGSNGAVTNFAGNITGTGSVTKTGPGETTFSGTNTFTGGLTVNQGRLVLASPNAFSGGIAVTGGGVALSVSTDASLGNAANVIALITGGTFEAAGSFTTARPFTTSSTGSISVTTGNTLSASAPMTGNGNLTKSGLGTLRSTAANTLSGQLNVDNDGGTFSLTVSGTALNVQSERVNNGGVLELNNNQGGNLADRLPDSAPVFLDGGTLRLAGVDGGSSVETLGQLVAEEGKSTVVVGGGNGSASNATLTFAGGLGPRASGATLNVTGTGLGTSSRVLLSGQASGRLPTWIKANGLFATYDPVYGVVPTTFVPPPNSLWADAASASAMASGSDAGQAFTTGAAAENGHTAALNGQQIEDTAVVPEPVAIGCVSTWLFGMFARRRKRHTRQVSRRAS